MNENFIRKTDIIVILEDSIALTELTLNHTSLFYHLQSRPKSHSLTHQLKSRYLCIHLMFELVRFC